MFSPIDADAANDRRAAALAMAANASPKR